ncbi:MAG: apolipoprotein N-acyltransferase [Gammaproteobacteria bacterium]
MTARLSRRVAAHPRLADGIAIVAGVVSVFAYAPIAWRPLSVITLAALFLLWLDCTPWRAFRRGYLFGLAFFGVGVSWVYNSIHEFGHAPVLLAAVITLAFVLFLSLYPALTGWLARRYFKTAPAVLLIAVLPALWVLLEWMRGWVITGFPWLLLGQAQLDTPLAGVIPVLGAYGASWLAAITAGLLACLLVIPLRAVWLPAAAIVVVWLAAAGLKQIEWTQARNETFGASLIQGNIPQDQKWLPAQRLRAIDMYAEMTRASWGSDLIIWPESAIPAYYQKISPYLAPLIAEVREHNAILFAGAFYFDAERETRHNSLVKIDAEEAVYHKRHLVPFGEFMPLRALLQWTDSMLDIPMADLSSGEGQPLLMAADVPIGISICYEDAYGNETLDAFPEAQLLINVSNDAWFGDSFAPHQHLEIARLRALETERFLLRATNTGVSAVIGPSGALIDQLPQFEKGVLNATVDLRTGLTPFARWGNWGVVVLLSAMLAVLWLSSLGQRNKDIP